MQVYCCVSELGEAKLQQVEASWQSFKQRGWAVHFIDLTSLYLRLKIGAGRAVKAHLVGACCSPLSLKGLMHSTRCLLHSLPLNDEARSGRRDLNPQPQPWQGYALPLSYFRQRGNIKQRSTTEQFTYHLKRTTSVFPPDHTLDLRSSYEHE